MNIQSELQLENNLIKQLGGLGYESVAIASEKELLANLKRQLEKHNAVALGYTELSEREFLKILNHLNKGGVFDRAKTLRDKFQFTRDDGSSAYIEFINKEQWCQNQYQVTHQITQEGHYKNRYDVTLLINGLPLAQIELKRRGLELKEAFNQINRYQRHSFWSSYGLFQYVQIFVISNGVNTKYYANNRRQSFKQTFYWADKENNIISNLDAFVHAFLEKCHLSKMICKYIVLHETDKVLMVLRPYQYYAVEAIINRVKNGNKNGYIWHTTGSGKTLTSFKASQILVGLEDVDKVLFVVDRNDLDYQTAQEFNHFSNGSVDSTDNTKSLVSKMSDDTKLIVTTIQKLNNAISNKRHLEKMEQLKDKKIIFIFDECHRSQFGETHKRIRAFFDEPQMFGFTGTPIFAENAFRNAMGKRTTKELFGDCLHKYVITNAIRDENVLKFSVEYWGKLKKKDGSLVDEQVKGIDIKGFYEHEDRIDLVTDWIIAHHNSKTHNKAFTALLCVGSVDGLMKYYEAFKAKKEAGKHDLRIATIFTYGTNEDDADADGGLDELDFDISKAGGHTRERLDSYIADYNAMYGTNFSTRDSQSFYTYYKDIAKRIKDRERDTFQEKDRVDILLVVNMFLTGFDAKKVNTLYVDKNLKYHGLVQAYSRTNRIINDVKSQGNIVCFRNLKKNTDDAVALFSNPEANEIIFMEPYPDYVKQFNKGVKDLKAIAPSVESVNDLESEEEELAFVKAFRNLIRILNVLKSFSEFSFEDLGLTEQEFEDYKSKYLDLYDKRKRDGEAPESIIEDVDFELELIQRDDVNVTYILKLLAALHEENLKKPDDGQQESRDKQREQIISLIEGEAKLRSKRELIERFISDNLPKIKHADDIPEAFDEFWTEEKQKALKEMCETEGLVPERLQELIENYMFTGRVPLRDSIVESLETKPKILERKKIIERVIDKVLSFVHTFEDGMG